MKRIFIITIVLMLVSVCYGQKVYKFRVISTSYRSFLLDKWVKNTDSTGVLLVLDLDKQKITYYGQKEMSYSIIGSGEADAQEYGGENVNKTFKYWVIDDANDKCLAYFVYHDNVKVYLLLWYDLIKIKYELKIE